MTVASRIMLPTYAVLCFIVGAMYVANPGGMLGLAPVYSFQIQTLPLFVWGLLMLSISGLMVVALLLHRRLLYAYALCCCALTWLIWTVCFAVAAATNEFTSWLAPVLPLFVCIACVASVSSLLNREV